MDLLKRKIAPVTPEAWAAIDQEAVSLLKVKLAARQLVDVDGPHGWKLGAVNTGRLDLLKNEPAPGVGVGVRQMQPLLELRVPFKLNLMEMDSISRGLDSPNLDPLREAVERIALAEDRTVFHGFADAQIKGILESSSHHPISFGDMPEDRFAAVVRAWQVLQHAGIGGPYALAVGTDMHLAILEEAEDGYPIVKRIQDLLQGPIIRADVLDGGVLVSLRGGDFKLTLGQDLSIGYASSDRDEVELYLTGSHTFQTLERDASVELSFD
jgi:uncharacterized linocin/CFP29 family protein